MKEFKGTKGKWSINWNGHYHEIIPKSNDYNKKVAGFSTNLHDMTGKKAVSINGNDEDKSNALLISKAPEMLDMLEYIVSGQYIDLDDIKQLIKEATTI